MTTLKASFLKFFQVGSKPSFDSVPHDNANNICPGCGRELRIRIATDEEKRLESTGINKKFGYDLKPNEIMFIGEPCACGEIKKVFFKSINDKRGQ
jgi:hypothetical protein